MNKQERKELAGEIEDLREEIIEKVNALGALIRETGDNNYTASLIETNIMALMGVDGHWNSYGNVQRVISEMEIEDTVSDTEQKRLDEYESRKNAIRDNLGIDPEGRVAVEKSLKERPGKKIPAVKAYRNATHEGLLEAILAVEQIMREMTIEE